MIRLAPLSGPFAVTVMGLFMADMLGISLWVGLERLALLAARLVP